MDTPLCEIGFSTRFLARLRPNALHRKLLTFDTE